MTGDRSVRGEIAVPRIELSAGERAYREIRRRIVSLEMLPNTPASEVQLADYLKMSRTPVREALTRLSGEGLVDFRARAGTMVSPIRLEAVQTAQYVRETLELRVLGTAARSSDNQALFNISQSIEEQKFAISQSDMDHFFLADDKMHRALCALAGREAVWFVVSEAKTHMDRVRRMSLQDIDLSVLLDEHQQIAASVTFGNESAACSVMKTHLRRVMTDLDRLAVKHPEYFELQDGTEARHGWRKRD